MKKVVLLVVFQFIGTALAISIFIPEPVQKNTTVYRQGVPGVEGPMGMPGLQGLRGVQGIRGPSTIGETGTPGTLGEKGDPGGDGQDGLNGAPGRTPVLRGNQTSCTVEQSYEGDDDWKVTLQLNPEYCI